ncbi:DUF4381 domain-containing protein [Photobacterium profundum]|uniref:DUF4381 domain-containing protein n=1 Tax=Photobacterium profundum TaxID=74109 RepID=UPI003D131E84
MGNTDKLLSLAPLDRLPEPSWWPLPLSAWLMIGGIVLIIGIVLAAIAWRYGKGKVKRKALHQLAALAEQQDLPLLDNLLRRVALTYFPRHDVAGLTGEAWLKWLDAHLVSPQFQPLTSTWSQGLYRGRQLESCQWAACITASQAWITHLNTEAKC